MERKPIGIMPNPLDTREIFFTNLLLLGFEPGAMEAKFRIPFDRDMFVLPNKAAMEAVMHFLFNQLNAPLANEEFRNCWPVHDKTQAQQFRKVCFTWVNRIAEDEPEANLPRTLRSLFHSPGGDRFYAFLLSFSLLVGQKVLLREHGRNIAITERPRRTPHNQLLTRSMSKALRAHTAVCRLRFLDEAQCAAQAHIHWKHIAIEITKQNRAISKLKRDIEREVRQVESNGTKQQRVSQIPSKSNYQQEVNALKRTQRLQKVRDLWDRLEDIYDGLTQQRGIIKYVLDGEANRFQINASDIQLKVPDLLLRTCEQDLQKGSIGNTFISGKLSLLSLIQLWNLSMSLLLDQVRQDSVPDFSEHMPGVKSHLRTHQSHLDSMQALRSVVKQGTLTELRDSVEKLQLPLYRQLEQQGLSSYPFSVRHGLGLMPATPPISFAAADTPVTERITSFSHTLRQQPADAVSTPEIVQAWTKTLQKQQSAVDDLHFLSTSGHSNLNSQPTSFKHGQKTSQIRSQIPQPVRKANIKVQNDVQKSWKKLKELPTAGTMSVDRPKGRLKTSTTTPHFCPRICSQDVSDKKATSKPDKTTRIQQSLAEEIVNDMSIGPDEISSGRSSPASLTSDTPKAQALKDPIAGLDEGVFKPADLIPRTPIVKQRYEATPTENDQEQETEKLIDVHSPKPGRLFEVLLNQTTSVSTPDSVRPLVVPPTLSSQGKQDYLGDLENFSEDDLEDSLVTSEAVGPHLHFTPSEITSSSPATPSLALPVMDEKASFVRSTKALQLVENHFPLIPITPLRGNDQQNQLAIADPDRTVQLDSSHELRHFPEGLEATMPSSFQSPLIQLSHPVIASNDVNLLVMNSEIAAQDSESPHLPRLSPFGSYEPPVLGDENLRVAKPLDENDATFVPENTYSEREYLFTLSTKNVNVSETSDKFKANESVRKQDERNYSTLNENGEIFLEDVSADKTSVSSATFDKTAISLSSPRQVDTSELMRRLTCLKQAQSSYGLSSDRTAGPHLLPWSRAPMTPSSTPRDEERSPIAADLYRRLDQIRQAQKRKEVTSADNTGSTSIKALSAPFTSAGAVTRCCGTEMDAKCSQKRFELSDLPIPPNETYLLSSPEYHSIEEARASGPVETVFSLDLPPSCKKVFQEKSPNGRLNYIPDQGPRKTPSRWDLDYERGSLMTTGLENFLSSESITPSGTWLTNCSRRNLKFEHPERSNESPFLVPDSPFVSNVQQGETSYLSPSGRRERNNNMCSPLPLSSVESLPTDTVPVVDQLVDLE